jgi:23S rRNA A2030 N6-methylase RlmJ
MIVRISGEGQYRLADNDAERLNELENGVVSIVEGGTEDGFSDAFAAMLDYVRAQGTTLADDELETSDVILPPSDISFEEAGSEFTGEGLIPD